MMDPEDHPVEIHRVEPGDVSVEWRALARRVQAIPFTWPDWILTWHAAFGTGPLRVLAAYRAGRLVGVLPLQRRRGLTAAPTNWHTPQFAVVADSPAVEEALLMAAVRQLRWQLDLSFVDQRTVDLILSAAQRLGLDAHARQVSRNAVLAMDGTHEDYLAKRPRKLRADLRSRERKLGHIGEVAVTVYRDRHEGAFAELVRVEGTGWKAREGSALAVDVRAGDFYRRIARWAAREGWLRLGVLRAGETVVAADFALAFAGTLYGLKTGYDEAYQSFAPGKLLTSQMIAGAFADEDLKRYEFLGADNSWKLQWTDASEPRFRVQVFGAGPGGRLMRAAQVHGRPRVKAIVDASTARRASRNRLTGLRAR